MNISKQNLKELQTVVFESMEGTKTKIPAKYVADVNFKNISRQKKCGYMSDFGVIVFTAEAADLPTDVYETDEGIKETVTLEDRFGAICDINAVTFVCKDKRLRIKVPCNPLVCKKVDVVVEYSEMPSFEKSFDGKTVIKFGKASCSGKRKDNDFRTIVRGYGDTALKDVEGPLKVRADRIYASRDEVSFLVRVKDAIGKEHQTMWDFFCVSEQYLSLDLRSDRLRRLRVSKLQSGEIFAELEGIGYLICEGASVCPV